MISTMDPLSPRTTSPPAAPLAMRRAAESFEAQALAQMLAPAFATVDASRGPFGGGAAEAQWRPMLVDAMAGAAARSGRGIGLADQVLRQMLRTQEAAAGDQAASSPMAGARPTPPSPAGPARPGATR